MLPGRIARILAFIVVVISVLSCGGQPAQPEPAYVPPAEVKPTERPPTKPPKPTSTTRPTAIPRPTSTATNTQPPPAPGSMNLPDLPGFRGSVITSAFGGGPTCDDYYQGPPAVVGGANLFLPARTGLVCIYGLSLDQDFRIEIIALNGNTTLGGNYYASRADGDIYWRNFNLGDAGSFTDWLGPDDPPNFMLIGTAYTRFGINIRWRGDLSSDAGWTVRVLNQDLILYGDFAVVTPEYPSITVVDSRIDWIIPAYSTCHFADEPQDLSALAEGYPPNREIYLYVYEQNDGLVFQSTAWTDGNGHFYVPIRGPYRQNGKYFLIAVPEPLVRADLPEGNLVDCFYVP